MRDVDALHTAARRYCRARHDEAWDEYRDLALRLHRNGKGSWITNEATTQELAVFPRYLVLWAILKDVERLAPANFASVDGLREALTQIGWAARDEATENPAIAAGVSAMQDQRRLFVDYIGSLAARELAAVAPLPYRRVLPEFEWKQVWTRIESRWRIDGAWYPLVEGAPPLDVLPFHVDYFDLQKIDALRNILAERGIARVIELRWSVGQELELESFCPSFAISAGSGRLYGAGEEAYWTGTEETDWLVYVSHESSITIAGAWLISRLERAFPDCRAFTYLGEISTPDRRGRW